jgi:hypothetical protein
MRQGGKDQRILKTETQRDRDAEIKRFLNKEEKRKEGYYKE